MAFPNIKIVTWNIQGTSHNSTNPNLVERNRVLKSNLKFLTYKEDSILALQECKLKQDEDRAFAPELPKHRILYNNLLGNKAGTVFIYPKSLETEHRVLHEVIQKGYIQRVKFTNKETGFSFTVINVYMYPGSGALVWKRRTKFVKIIMGLELEPYTFIVGDWNFLEAKRDTTGTYSKPPDYFKVVWQAFVAKHRICEAEQSIKTCLTIK